MNPVDRYLAYAFEKLAYTMELLMKAEASDERKQLREQAAAYAAIITALKDY